MANGKQGEGNSWGFAGMSLQAVADYGTKASEAQEAGKTTLAAGYRKAAEISQRASDQYKLSAQTIVIGKQSEANSWGNEGKSLQAVADYKAKASEAQEIGKIQLTAGYQEALAISQKAADQWKLSGQTKVAGKQDEGISWGCGGKSLQTMADYQAKVSEAQEAGKIQLAEGYEEAAATSQKAADQYKQSAQARAEGKVSESTRLLNEGKAIQIEADAIAKKLESKG